MDSTMSVSGRSIPVGNDTFRGSTLGPSSLQSTLFRTQLYEKNLGEVRQDRTGLVRTDSPLSGNLLLSTSSVVNKVKDPIAGSVLRYQGRRAVVTAPQQKQEQFRCRNFFLQRDVDVTIQTLRNTTKVSQYTNEKVGTAGTMTGMDKKLTESSVTRGSWTSSS